MDTNACYLWEGENILNFQKKIKKRHLLVQIVTHPQAATLSTLVYLIPRFRERGCLLFPDMVLKGHRPLSPKGTEAGGMAPFHSVGD